MSPSLRSKLCRLTKSLGCVVLSGLVFLSFPGLGSAAELPPPPTLEQLQKVQKGSDLPTDETQIRNDAMREAALSFGARGGLSRRTYEIRQQLARNESSLTYTFDFRRLLIAAPSGLLIEPPVVTEADRAFLLGEEGQSAAVADRVYNINQKARIVSTARDWRTYLERDWGEISPPPAILLPRNDDERKLWDKWVAQGWKEGVTQADEIFQMDIDRLERDFDGMVRYRGLLAQKIVTPPFAALEDRGITGGGDEMRIGDREVRITKPAELNPRSETWLPASR